MPREVERRGVAIVDGEVQRRAFAAEMRNSGVAPGTFEGHVAMFDSESEDLGFIERIKPGAFKNALAKKSTVVALHNHDSNRLLGSTANGTLDLSEDARGLKVVMRPPDTPTAREVATLVEGGFSNGASFAFTVAEGGDSWGIDGKGRVTREISEVDTLLDVSIVTNPAYLAPSVTPRTAQMAVEVRSKAERANLKPDFRTAIAKGVFRRLPEKREKSFEDKLEMIWTALCELLGSPWDNDYNRVWYVEATFEDRVIVERDYILWSYPMTFDADSKPVFGEPSKVQIVYAPVVDPAVTRTEGTMSVNEAQQALAEAL